MLLSSWFFVLLIGLSAFPLAAWIGFGIRRRVLRRRGEEVLVGWRLVVARTAALVLILALVAATVADGLNRHYSYIPTFQALFGDVSPDLVRHRGPMVEVAAAVHPRPGEITLLPPMPTHGVVQPVKIGGDVSGVEPRDAFVYLPPQYFDPQRPDRRFPVLYMLHGSPGISLDWLRGGYIDRAMDRLLADHHIDPFIVVLPDFNGGYKRDTECQDVAHGPQVQTYLTVDVPDFVDGHFRTLGDRTARAIGGLSTGAYCALNLGLRHQDVFSAVVWHSGYVRPDVNRYTGNLFGADQELRLANTPEAYMATIALSDPFGVYLDVGEGDVVSRRQGEVVNEVLGARGIPVTFNVVHGESHSWAAWRDNLNFSLPWVSHWFDRDIRAVGDGLPSVQIWRERHPANWLPE